MLKYFHDVQERLQKIVSELCSIHKHGGNNVVEIDTTIPDEFLKWLVRRSHIVLGVFALGWIGVALIVLCGLWASSPFAGSAHAQQGFAIPVRVVELASAGTINSHYVLRAWSDGTIEQNVWSAPNWEGWELVPE